MFSSSSKQVITWYRIIGKSLNAEQKTKDEDGNPLRQPLTSMSYESGQSERSGEEELRLQVEKHATRSHPNSKTFTLQLTDLQPQLQNLYGTD